MTKRQSASADARGAGAFMCSDLKRDMNGEQTAGWRRFGVVAPEDWTWIVICDPDDLEPRVGQYRDGGLYWRYGAHTVHEDMWWWPVPQPPQEFAND